jgi:hypothetical protein
MDQPEAFEGMFMKDAQLFYSLFGAVCTRLTPLTVESELPNPISGDKIPCRITFRTQEADLGSLVIRLQNEWNAEAARQSMRKALTQMAQQFKKPEPPADALLHVEVSEEGTFQFHEESGWPEAIEMVRRITIDDGYQEEKTVIQIPGRQRC